jgi:hypothetical protein
LVGDFRAPSPGGDRHFMRDSEIAIYSPWKSDRAGRRQQAKMCALAHFAPGTAASRNGFTAVASAREELML